MRRSFTWTIAIALAIVVALPLGCGCRQKVADKAIEKVIETQAKKDGKDVDVKMDSAGGTMSIKTKDGSDNVNVNIEQGKMTVTSEGGEKKLDMKSDDKSFSIQTKDGMMVAGDAAKLPENFPKDVPVYPGAKPTLVSTMAGNETFNVSFDTADTIDQVGAYYRKELTANGWQEQQTINQAGDQPMQMLNYTKEERMVMVTVTRDGDKTVLSLMVSKNG